MRGSILPLATLLCFAACQSRKPEAPTPPARPAAAEPAPEPAPREARTPAQPEAPLAPNPRPTPRMPADDLHALAAAKGARTPAHPVPPSGLRGKVLERLEAPPYCYLRLATGTGEVWAAVPQATAELGSEVTVENPMLMKDFVSKTLDRTFPEVYFGALTETDALGRAANPHGSSPHTTAGRPTLAAESVKVERAAGPGARTVAEVWAQKARLARKTVIIRGKIVKYNEGVMGRNWIHLQDGTGTASLGTHDLTVTTLDTASKGDVVTIKGVVQLNRDFGSGYAYELIIEDAKVQRNL